MNRSRPARRGMTLLEVVLAMAIFALIAGGVQRILSASMQTAADLRRVHFRDNQVQTLFELLRETFRTLPVEAVLETRVDEGTNFTAIVLRKSPISFALGSSAVDFRTRVVTLDRQIGGRLRLSLRIEPEEERLADRSEEMPPPAVLLGDLSKVEWRFYEKSSATWLDAWTATERPGLIELQLVLAGETKPRIARFWMPQLERNANTGRGPRPDTPPPPGPSPSPGASPGPPGPRR